MNEFEIKEKTDLIWRVCYSDQLDITDLSIIKDEKNRVYLSGKILFAKLEYDYLLLKKQTGILTLDIRYNDENAGWIVCKLSLQGEWNYRQKTCALEVSSNDQYDEFEKIIDIEHNRVPLSVLDFEFDSYLISYYGTLGLDGEGKIYEGYQNCGSETPSTWNIGTTYQAANDLTGGEYAGDLDRFVFLSGTVYASLTDNNLGNNPASEPVGPLGEYVYWYPLDDLYRYSQERSEFNFDENADFNENQNYYYKANCSSNTYNEFTLGYKIETALQSLLDDTDFSLADNWLSYATSINANYKNTYVSNSDPPEKITISEIIKIVETLFNCQYRLENYQLTFKHWTELNKEYSGYAVSEHYYINRTDINLFKTQGMDEVFEHRLNFSKSNLQTHPDSIITYDNEYKDQKKLSGSFDVDFVFCYNKKGKTCPIIIDPSTNEIEYDSGNNIYNPNFIPSLLHESFYLEGREFSKGELNGLFVTLEPEYKEQTEFEAKGSLRINYFDFTEKVLILQGIYGKWIKVEKNILENKYKLVAAIQ